MNVIDRYLITKSLTLRFFGNRKPGVKAVRIHAEHCQCVQALQQRAAVNALLMFLVQRAA